MKKIFIICTLILSNFFNVYGQKNKLDQLFDKYQEVEGVTSIKIAKPMFGMLSKLNIADAELDQIKPLLSKIDGLKVLITENPEGNSKANINQLNKEISTYVKNLNYSEIMSVNNGGSKIKFLSSEAKSDGILEDILLSIDSGSGENILVMLDGRLSMDDVNKIINSSETKTNTSRTTITNSFNSDNSESYLNGENRNVGEFSKIDVSVGVNVNYKQERTTSVKVLADADKLQHVITKVENGVLKVYIDNKGEKHLKFKNLTVNVSSPKMNAITTSSGATFTAVSPVRESNLQINATSGSVVKGKFDADNADFNISSGSDLKAELTAQKLNLKNSSGASATLDGTAKSAMLDLSSGASCKAGGLMINTAQAESTSGASLSLYVKDKLKVRASSGGSVRLKGNPELDSKIDKISGGSLKQSN